MTFVDTSRLDALWFSLRQPYAARHHRRQGRIKAVMWTDAFQVLVLIAGLSAVLIKGSIDMGGMGNIWAIMEERNRTYVYFDTDPRIRHTFWTLSSQLFRCFTKYPRLHPGESRAMLHLYLLLRLCLHQRKRQRIRQAPLT
ncbi:hypothetical protein CAPTEDRAFT_216025 [Capitella teleta]|uniref:Uncharacterized protein n=1 Tax=Capitella teleta TaxID=283909 RepID=R7TS61_CAPTE|nr:hypothetical protein CAPTEDRAFT_216025 [Capitella teleta]|eukprot:ELT96494.1 hypothetical protein CAPTEDRAFT_216025 [Capitella teleta]